MRLSVVSRALVASWSLWFTAALSEVPGLHTCAVHDGHAMHASVAEHMGHAGHMAHQSESSAPTDQSHHQAGCTCLGLCCCAAPAVVPATSIELAAEVVVAQAALPDKDVANPTVQRAHSLPFANGPPAL